MKVLTVVALLLCAGCAGRQPVSGSLCASRPAEPTDPVPVVRGPLLETDADCHMVRMARADDAHYWFWAEIVLPEGACARVEGPGALAAIVADAADPHHLLDEGLYVHLSDGSDAYLNSSGGPITIRHYHGAGGGRVRFLIRLPDLGEGAPRITALKPVSGRWTYHP